MNITVSSSLNAAIDQMFAALDGVLSKAAEHAASNETEESVYLNWRLAPDMLPMVRQVRIATELPARAMSRLAAAEMPSFADDEETFEALRDRIKKARAHIKSLPADALDLEPEAPITFPVGPDREMTMPRLAYVQHFILPNLYFHVTTAYAILRRIGVPLGKMDYMAAPQNY
jgi:hypothetical protein